jgi:hypothetical protein
MTTAFKRTWREVVMAWRHSVAALSWRDKKHEICCPNRSLNLVPPECRVSGAAYRCTVTVCRLHRTLQRTAVIMCATSFNFKNPAFTNGCCIDLFDISSRKYSTSLTSLGGWLDNTDTVRFCDMELSFKILCKSTFSFRRHRQKHKMVVVMYICWYRHEIKANKLVPVHSMKAYRGSRGTGPLVLNHGTRWSWGWVGPAAGLDVLDKQKISCPCQDPSSGLSTL